MDHMNKYVENLQTIYRDELNRSTYHFSLLEMASSWHKDLPEEETFSMAFHDFLMFASQLWPLLAKSCVTIL